MYRQKVDCVEASSMEKVTNCKTSLIDNDREDGNPRIEPSNCHAKDAYYCYFLKSCLAEASDILGKNICDIMQIHNNSSRKSNICKIRKSI